MAGPRPASRLKSRNKNQRKGGKPENDGSNSNGNDGTKQDEAVLKKPIETSVIGLIRALKVLENGTPEVRDYLSNECDIIYECRVCRSLFRSLANFILHKRVYCQDTYESTFNRDRRFQEDEQLFIQSETELKQEDDNQETDKKSKDLSSIIDRLGKKIDTNPFPTTNVKISDLPITSHEDNIKNVLSLQTVEGTVSGMFQTISENSYENDSEFMKTEVMELHMMENDGGAVIGPDGRCLGFRTSTKSPNTVYNDFKMDFMNEDSYNGKLECEKCNQKFSTRKTLRFHLNTKHSENRLVYPCPDCAETFVNPWGVYRHLFKVHRKTSSEVRKLRDTVQNSSYQMDQAPIRKIKPDTNTEIVLSEQERLHKKNEEWMENLECDNDLQCCGGCGRRFERKAALHSHSLMCQKRIAACNKIKRAAQSDDKSSSAKSKSVVKKNLIMKKKSNNEDSTPEKNSYDVTPNESRSSSRAEIITENIFVEKETISSKNSSSINSLKLILSDDDSLEEVPVKDPLGVSDTEETTPPIVPTPTPPTTETTVSRVIFNDVDTSLPTDKNSEKDSSSISATDKDNMTLENINDDNLKPIGPTFINDMLAVRMKAFTNVGRKFVCMPCDYRYSSLASLRRHMAIHFSWKRFRCLRCDFMCFDKREAIVHAQTTHHATLDVIKKFVTRMPETESDSYSSKVFLPLNTTPQEIITLDDSDDDSTKHENQNMEDAKSTTSSTVAANDEDSNVQNEFSRNLIMEMIIGNSEPSQKINISSSSIESSNSTCDLPPSMNTSEVDPLPPTSTIVESTSKFSSDLIVETKLSNETIEKLSNEIILSSAPSTSNTDDSIKTSTNISSSRPVRNRVKPVNKDFIYDMSAFTSEVEDFSYTTKSKRKTDCDIKDIEQNKFTLDTSDTITTSSSKAKKRRRNSKVYTSSNCSNSSNNSWESNENVRIVPIIDYTQISSSNFIRKPEEIITNDRNDLVITPTSTTHSSQSDKTSIVTTTTDSEQTPVSTEFMIHSVMSVNT